MFSTIIICNIKHSYALKIDEMVKNQKLNFLHIFSLILHNYAIQLGIWLLSDGKELLLL